MPAAEHDPVIPARHGKVRMRVVSILNPANFLTTFRILLVPVYLWLFSQSEPVTAVFALIVFVIAALTDLLDGHLARTRKEITKLGKFLDPLADKFLVVGALVQFWAMGLVSFWLVLVIIIRDIWVTFMRILAISRGKELRTSSDAKLKTTIQLTVVITTIVLYGARLIALDIVSGYTGFWVDLSWYILLFNCMLGVAVAFTLYSWATYMFRRRRKKS